MLGHPDVGVAVLAPLMRFEGPPEPFLRRCRERIDKEGGKQRPSLLAAAKVLAGLRFVEPELLELFLRSEAMIESPVIKEIVEEAEARKCRENIESAIRLRFEALSDDARARLQGVKEDRLLSELHSRAITCPTMEAFLERLNRETTPAPKPTSSRRKRKN